MPSVLVRNWWFWILISIAVGVPVVFFIHLALREKVELRWTFTPGEKFRYRVSSTTDEHGVLEVVSHTYLIAVKEVSAEGVATLQITFEALSYKSPKSKPPWPEYPEVDYDSGRDGLSPTDFRARVNATAVGKSITLRVTTSGQVLQISGAESLWEGIRATSQRSSEPAYQVAVQSYAPDTLKEGFGTIFGPLPNNPVTVGESWKIDGTVPNSPLMEIRFSRIWTLRRVSQRKSFIDVRTTYDFSPPKEGLGVAVLNADASGQLVFDVDRGLVESLKITQTRTAKQPDSISTDRSTIEVQLLNPGH